MQSYIEDNDSLLSHDCSPYLLEFRLLDTVSYTFDSKPIKLYMMILKLKIWQIVSTLSLLCLNETVLLSGNMIEMTLFQNSITFYIINLE